MIGVVLWSDPPTGRAVIWCEDHSGLAYLTGQDDEDQSDGIGVADVVSFTLKDDGGARHVCDVKRLDQSWGHTLLASLKTNASGYGQHANQADNVIPLRRHYGDLPAAATG